MAKHTPDQKQVDRFINKLPTVEEIRHKLTLNLRERRLLTTLLRLAEQRRAATEKGREDV